MLELTRQEAELVLNGCGFRKLSGWNDELMEKKLAGILDVLDDNPKIDDDTANAILTDIIKEIKKGDDGQIVVKAKADDGPDDLPDVEEFETDTVPVLTTKEELKKKRKGRRGKQKQDEKESQPAAVGEPDEKAVSVDEIKTDTTPAPIKVEADNEPKKDVSKKDRFGFRFGTKSSRVAGCLSIDAPKSMKELLAEAGVEKQQYGLLLKLVRDGLVEKTEDKKYRLKEQK